MSIRAYNWAWERLDVDSHTDLLVLLALADHANDDGECWPGHAYVARKARLDERTVPRVIRRLAARGLVRIAPREGKSNRYTLNLADDPGWAATGDADTPGSAPGVGEGETPGTAPGVSPPRVDSKSPPTLDSQESTEPSITVTKPSAPPVGSAGDGQPTGGAAEARHANTEWKAREGDLRQRFGGEAFEEWLDQATPDKDDGATLSLAVATRFYAEYLQAHYAAGIEEVVGRKVVFTVERWAGTAAYKRRMERQQQRGQPMVPAGSTIKLAGGRG